MEPKGRELNQGLGHLREPWEFFSPLLLCAFPSLCLLYSSDSQPLGRK